MKTIPVEIVNSRWQRISDADEEQAKVLAKAMQRDQPFLMVYLLAMDEQLFAEDEQGRLMEFGAFVYGIMSEGQRLRKVKDRDIERAEANNLKMLQKLDEGSEMEFASATENLVSNYNQAPLLRAILEALMSEYTDAPDLAPESIGLALVYLKTVIDCLDQ